MESTQGQELEEHRLKYMQMLQTYIAQQGDIQEANAKKLGNVYELIYDIQDLWYHNEIPYFMYRIHFSNFYIGINKSQL